MSESYYNSYIPAHNYIGHPVLWRTAISLKDTIQNTVPAAGTYAYEDNLQVMQDLGLDKNSPLTIFMLVFIASSNVHNVMVIYEFDFVKHYSLLRANITKCTMSRLTLYLCAIYHPCCNKYTEHCLKQN